MGWLVFLGLVFVAIAITRASSGAGTPLADRLVTKEPLPLVSGDYWAAYCHICEIEVAYQTSRATAEAERRRHARAHG